MYVAEGHQHLSSPLGEKNDLFWTSSKYGAINAKTKSSVKGN